MLLKCVLIGLFVFRCQRKQILTNPLMWYQWNSLFTYNIHVTSAIILQQTRAISTNIWKGMELLIKTITNLRSQVSHCAMCVVKHSKANLVWVFTLKTNTRRPSDMFAQCAIKALTRRSNRDTIAHLIWRCPWTNANSLK